MSFWRPQGGRISIQERREIPRMCSEWHLLVILRCGVPKNLAPNVTALAVWCHSERSVSEVKNLKQIAQDSSCSFGMTIMTCWAQRNTSTQAICMRSLTCVRDDMIVILRCCVPKAKRMLFWTKRERSVESQTNSRGFLTYVQNDKGLPPSQYAVILRCKAPKNLPSIIAGDSSCSFGMTAPRKTKISHMRSEW